MSKCYCVCEYVLLCVCVSLSPSSEGLRQRTRPPISSSGMGCPFHQPVQDLSHVRITHTLHAIVMLHISTMSLTLYNV